MEPGEQGYFAVATTSGNYDGLTLADAGGMIVVQQAGQGWILRMPDGATGSKTLTWTASCGRSATMSVSNWCVPSSPPQGFALVYPVNSGPVYALTSSPIVTLEDNVGLQDGDWYVGRLYLNRDYAWLKYGTYIFGYSVYRGECV